MLSRMTMTWDALLSPTRQVNLARGDRIARADPLFNEFDQDHGRAVFSSPIRRLQDKAQVFPMDPTDAIRTRLTHSMEVSSVARGLARRIAVKELGEGRLRPESVRDLETVVATSALLHDLGNPPFGHAGEGAMRDWFRRQFADHGVGAGLPDAYRRDFELFEGNAQSIRLVSRLQLLVRDDGLNLTCATLGALQKYVVAANDVDGTSHSKKKPGFFQSEANLVQEVREELGMAPAARNPLALMMEAADDICYSVVDLEDGTKKGAVQWPHVLEAFRRSEQQDPGRIGLGLCEKAMEQVDAQKPADMPSDATEQAYMQMFRVMFIGRAVKAAANAFEANRDAIMAGDFLGELNDAGDCFPAVKVCKGLGRSHVYREASILRLELRGRRVISDLLDFYWMGAGTAVVGDDGVAGPGRGARQGMAERAFDLISENYVRVFRRAVKEEPELIDYHRLQLIADQVCGMTDSYACGLHADLCGG